MNKSFCILIPTINRADLLRDALEYYELLYPNTEKLILDNGNQEIVCYDKRATIYKSEHNLGVAGSWNFLIKKAIEKGYGHFLVLNDDVILKKHEDIINGIINAPKTNFFVCDPSNHWSSFILSKHIYDKVGEFDENFKKCFYEDNDYAYRMKLASMDIHIIRELNPEEFLNNGSTLEHPELRGDVENRDYYVKKWGGMPNFETYTTPFNQ